MLNSNTKQMARTEIEGNRPKNTYINRSDHLPQLPNGPFDLSYPMETHSSVGYSFENRPIGEKIGPGAMLIPALRASAKSRIESTVGGSSTHSTNPPRGLLIFTGSGNASATASRVFCT